MELIPHKQFGNLRAIVIDNTPWFCGKDVATALDYAKPRNALKRHVSENQMCIYETLREALDKSPATGPSSELHPHTVFINEAGVHSLVMGSRLPAAVAFKDWVCCPRSASMGATPCGGSSGTRSSCTANSVNV